ncbi:MAG: glycoside hydrolase family 13 protein [Ruminococcus sp.]|nr:glycoside hydrolase family 13 protein [Ruminococcus sp.]MBQ8904740.1 glycoside hydrolase family 13 protein [Ruminococcus sp.]
MERMYNSWNKRYKSKFGAIKRNEPCTFTLRIPDHIKLDGNPIMVLFRTGFKERFISMNSVEKEKDCTAYSATYSAKYSGVHYYYFSYISGGVRYFVKRGTADQCAINDGGLYQLTIYDDDFETPKWIQGGVMYQIFPDRFFKSGVEHEGVPTDRVMREDWGGTPYYKPDENGHVWNNDYFGGDLDGIRQKLSYLKSLGVTCIYLNPIFESHENHRYNTANYRNVDPMLGTNKDFSRLCAEARKMGMAVILDGVFSHTGADSIYFNKFNRYDSVGAYNSKESPYYPWYSFTDYPNGYEAWWGIDTLPNVNENNPEYTEYICGEDGVIDSWLKQGASGFRLDVADELPDQFLENLRKAVKNENPNNLLIGEVWEDASNKEAYGVLRRYLLGSQLDSVMNYPFRSAILDYVRGGSPFDFRNRIMTILENYPKPAIDVMMNFVSTHDVERAINILGGESCEGKSKDWMAEKWLTEDEYRRGKNLLKCAMVLQFFLPGVPSIYYGDEAGMQGYKDPFNRRCYPWGNEDHELIDFTAGLSAIRKSTKVFHDGKLKFLMIDDDVILFARYRTTSNKAMIIGLNRSAEPKKINIATDITEQYSITRCDRGEYDGGKEITIAPYDYIAVKVEY